MRYPAVVCSAPFGLPVVPEVYKMNKVSSESISSHGQLSLSFAIKSLYHTSRGAWNGIFPPVRFTTRTCSMVLHSGIIDSTSVIFGYTLPERGDSSHVIKMRDFESSILSLTASFEKPPNTTE